MSGSNITFNIAKGTLATRAALPAASDALLLVLLRSSGLVADGTLADYDDLAALLAGASDEFSDGTPVTSYARVAVTNPTVTVDDTNDRVDLDMPDQTWAALGGASNGTSGKLIICYDPDTTAGTDSTVVPQTAHSFDATTDGTDLTALISNYARIT